MLKKVISDESGRALVLALIILGIGALLIPTFLTHASTNLLATQATEKGMKELYAADAGVEHAIWRIKYEPGFPPTPYTYTIAINDMTVAITVTQPLGWAVGEQALPILEWPGTILRTTDGGQSWERQTVGVPDADLYSVFFVNESEGWAVGEQELPVPKPGTILHTTNGGQSWERQTVGVIDADLQSVFFVNENEGWAVGKQGLPVLGSPGTILHTTDGGQSWTQQEVGVPDADLYSVFFVNENTGWAVGEQGPDLPVLGEPGTILHTTDGGQSWTQQEVGVPAADLQSVFFVNESEGWAVGKQGLPVLGSPGTILHTTDGGQSWTQQEVGVPDADLYSVFFVNENTGWAVGKQDLSVLPVLESPGTILHTIDGGQSWERQTVGVPAADLQSVFFVGDIYKITSTATSYDGSSTTIVSYVKITESSSDGSSVFDYALCSLDGDIEIKGSGDIESDVELEGDVYAYGDIDLVGSAEVYGDATATGTIDSEEDIHGVSTEHADPEDGPTAPDIDTDAYKTTAQGVECAVCGDITRWGDWSPPEGDYGREHVQNNLSMSGAGTWIFTDTVCAGIGTNEDIDISGSAEVTFEGPVKVGRDLDAGGSGTVIFGDTVEDTVCVGRDLEIDRAAIFKGPVKVGGDLKISTSSTVTFESTVYVEGDLKGTGSGDIEVGDIFYVHGKIDLSGSGFKGGDATIVADGDIVLTGSGQLNVDEIPFVISTKEDGEVRFSGSNEIWAIIYAPYSDLTLTGSGDLHGCVVAKSITKTGSGKIEYPIELRDREDLHGGGVEGGELEVRTYNIYP